MSKNKIIILYVTMLLIIIILFVLLIIKPKIIVYYNELEVNNEINHEVFNKFNYPKIKSKFLNKDVSNQVVINGNIDENKVGTYEIQYNLKIFIYNIKKSIRVNVVDSIKPEIILNGDYESHACSIQSYKEDGFQATDNYDGDLTDKVSIQKDNDIIKYSVKDSSNNEVVITRKIIASDIESPKLKLNGKEIIRVPLNKKYEDEGVSVTDNCDTVIDNIEIDNKVDYSKIGVYEIVYTATDSSNNTSSIKRYIYIYDPQTEAKINVGKKGVIYLTFDDGPSIYTSKILDVLSKYNIKATFFVTNNGKDNVIKREFDEGHTVALHTATHSYKKVYKSVKDYFKDLESVQNRVYNITGEKPMIIRFPGGSSNTISKNYSKGIMTILTSEVLVRGYHYFDWTSAIEDAGSCSSKKSEEEKEKCIYNYFVKGLSKKRSNVVLMHDIKSYTANKLEDMINYAIKEGYTFDKITMETEQIHHKVNN